MSSMSKVMQKIRADSAEAAAAKPAAEETPPEATAAASVPADAEAPVQAESADHAPASDETASAFVADEAAGMAAAPLEPAEASPQTDEPPADVAEVVEAGGEAGEAAFQETEAQAAADEPTFETPAESPAEITAEMPPETRAEMPADGLAELPTDELLAGADVSEFSAEVPEAQGTELQEDTALAASPEEPAAAGPSDYEPEQSAASKVGRVKLTQPPSEPEQTGFGEHTTVWDAQRVDPVIVAFHDRYSAICEQFRLVRARLLTMNTAQAQQVIAITSSIPEEGKSASTINLGLVMAEGGEQRILIADADFRRSSMARMLGLTPRRGMADVLRGEADLDEVLLPTPFPNLKILPAGEVRDNAYPELLGGPNLVLLIEQLRAAFDYTFVDTPPVTTVSDVCLLAPHCDGAILVVEMRRTPEPVVQQSVRTLQANNVKILGCVLSRSRERGSGYYENYYSSYYRSYYRR